MRISILKHLFDFSSPETKGEIIYHRVIELFLCYFSLLFMWEWASYITKLADVIMPAGIGNYIDISFILDDTVPYVIAGLASVFLVLGFFRAWKYSYAMAILLFHFLYIARYSQGKLSHGSHVIAMSLLVLALAHIFFETKKDKNRFAYGMMIFYLGFGYICAAVSKLIASGFTWIDGGHLWLWLGERKVDVLSQTGAFEANALQEALLQSYWLATFILFIGIFSEALGFLLWFKKTRPFIAILLIGMHIGILYSMNIFFDMNIYILILLAFPWALWIDKLLGLREGKEMVSNVEN